jgi:hypothetical protein
MFSLLKKVGMIRPDLDEKKYTTKSKIITTKTTTPITIKRSKLEDELTFWSRVDHSTTSSILILRG